MAKTQHGSELSGEEMGQMFDEFVNSSGKVKMEAFATFVTTRLHRTLQQSVMRMFWMSIEKWAAQTNFDLRNEGTVNLCKKIVKECGDNAHLPHV